ncbi:hypothetical protein CR513_09908, partial [Mucuna pruriens]
MSSSMEGSRHSRPGYVGSRSDNYWGGGFFFSYSYHACESFESSSEEGNATFIPTCPNPMVVKAISFPRLGVLLLLLERGKGCKMFHSLAIAGCMVLSICSFNVLLHLFETTIISYFGQNFMVAEACLAMEKVFLGGLYPTRPYTYAYRTIFIELGVRFPLLKFECGVLPKLDFPHGVLNLVLPSLDGVHCGQIHVCWLAFSGVQMGGILELYTSSYKSFKGDFVKISPISANKNEVLFIEDEQPHFPFYQQSRPNKNSSLIVKMLRQSLRRKT